MDIAARAGGLGHPLDLAFKDIRPEHGIIAIRFWNRFSGEAMVQAIEIAPADATPATRPVSTQPPRTP
ncbi:MAG: hypothetical protein KA354_14410 [Phycisphaerae bacterium]|nr:hypothetical protein [Phycisphaerae bacterium]